MGCREGAKSGAWPLARVGIRREETSACRYLAGQIVRSSRRARGLPGYRAATS
jgi:hypothetical protein